tara:strand:- start:460 stop:726 length:267 start_codon:yes stop_codon:yes gene_type:complete
MVNKIKIPEDWVKNCNGLEDEDCCDCNDSDYSENEQSWVEEALDELDERVMNLEEEQETRLNHMKSDIAKLNRMLKELVQAMVESNPQ